MSELAKPAITPDTTLGEIVDAHPGVLEVLEEFGIRIDPWTLIALRSPLSQLAEYSAVRPTSALADAVAAFLERE
jgi:hypothetical protein